MFTSSQSTSEIEETSAQDPDCQKSEGAASPQPRKFVYEKLVIFTGLLLLIVISLNLDRLPAFWSLLQSDSARGRQEITSSGPEYFQAAYFQPHADQGISKIFQTVTSRSLRVASEPTPLPLREPTATVIRRIKDVPPPEYTFSTPTATPTSEPEPLPLAAVRFIATDTPAPTPPPPPVEQFPTATPTLTPTTVIQAGIKHVVIISVDGLRPDAIIAADAPNLDQLIAQGSFCPKAQTVKTSLTLPSHASMVTGVIEEKHGFLWGSPYIGWPGMAGPTLFNIAHDAGLSTSMVFGKQKMNYIVLGDSVDKLFGQDAHDPEIRDQAIEFIEEGLADILFIHFPDTDRVGHAYGWMSQNQLYAIAFVDGLIGEIVAALKREGYLNNTLLIITADHGGHGFEHGDDSPLDRTIPWLALGPGVPAGVTIHRPVNTYDTAATVLYALDLPIPEKWDGRPVTEIFTLK